MHIQCRSNHAVALRALRRALIASILVAFAACDDHTVLTGPDAVSAAERFRAGGSLSAESSAADEGNPPLIILDGQPQESIESVRALLHRISPNDIDRIEVVMGGCGGVGRFGAAGRNGVVVIFTKGFDPSEWQLPEHSAERAEACRVEQDQRRRPLR